jgi:hypothetical protein
VACNAGYAPFLDYRPVDDAERQVISDICEAGWLVEAPEKLWMDYAIGHVVPEHFDEVSRRVVARVERTMAAVQERLTSEITHWDHRANQLKAQEDAGKQPKLNSAKARARADELQARLCKRRLELEEEKQLQPQPPVVVSAALVIPRGLLEARAGSSPPARAADTERTDRLAVAATMATEVALGRKPEEMPHNNPGYDIRSFDPATGEWIFIEVKGRVGGAATFTVTRNEILHALNVGGRYRLALVEVAPEPDDTTAVRYLTQPFSGEQDTYFDVTSVTYPWPTFWERGGPPS